MSFADDDEWLAFIGRDHMLPTVTTEAVEACLTGFALQLAPGKDMVWLATAVRRAFGISMRNISDGPDRASNAKVRRELKRLTGLADGLWQELFNCDHAADQQIWTVAWRRWDGEGGNVGEPSEYRRFRAAVQELDWLAGYLRLAAGQMERQRGPWRDTERKWLRIQRGQYLALIFEAAFGKRATANNYGSDARHTSPTPFMAFYKSMIELAFGPRETTNYSEVAKAACKRHREAPAQFAEGVIPGL